MLDMDKRLEPYIYNYKLNLMDYHDYENYDAFQDECRVVFEALAARDNEEKTDELQMLSEKIGVGLTYYKSTTPSR